MMMKAEFSRVLRRDEIGGGTACEIEANEIERAALARRFGLRAVGALAASFTVAPRAGGLAVTGRVKGTAIAACAISAEDVEQSVDEPVELLLVEDMQMPAPEEEVELSADDLDLVPLAGTTIDLGEIAAESFGLALDPYPRADAASVEAARKHVLSDAEAAKAHGEPQSSPFSALKGD